MSHTSSSSQAPTLCTEKYKNTNRSLGLHIQIINYFIIRNKAQKIPLRVHEVKNLKAVCRPSPSTELRWFFLLIHLCHIFSFSHCMNCHSVSFHLDKHLYDFKVLMTHWFHGTFPPLECQHKICHKVTNKVHAYMFKVCERT